jgi:hypothetical protein
MFVSIAVLFEVWFVALHTTISDIVTLWYKSKVERENLAPIIAFVLEFALVSAVYVSVVLLPPLYHALLAVVVVTPNIK